METDHIPESGKKVLDMNARIRSALGDDGRCWRECAVCGGSNELYGHHDGMTYGPGPCDNPYCNGGRVYDRDRLADALQEIRHELIQPLLAFWKRKSYRLECWDNRHDQPWRQSLEDWVHGVRCEHCDGKGDVIQDSISRLTVHTGACRNCNGTGWQVEPWTAKAPDYAEDFDALESLLISAKWGIRIERFPGSKYWRVLLREPNGMADERNGRQDEIKSKALVRAVTAALEP